jgi:hypothetical protein
MEWYPARCKMVLSSIGPDNHLQVTVDPDFPNAWRREPYYSKLRAHASRGEFVQIRVGRRFIGLNADGSETEVQRTQAHIEGRPETSP